MFHLMNKLHVNRLCNDFDFVYRPQSNPSPFRPIQSPGAHTYQNVGSPVKPSPNINTPLKKLEHSNSTGNFVFL